MRLLGLAIILLSFAILAADANGHARTTPFPRTVQTLLDKVLKDQIKDGTKYVPWVSEEKLKARLQSKNRSICANVSSPFFFVIRVFSHLTFTLIFMEMKYSTWPEGTSSFLLSFFLFFFWEPPHLLTPFVCCRYLVNFFDNNHFVTNWVLQVLLEAHQLGQINLNQTHHLQAVSDAILVTESFRDKNFDNGTTFPSIFKRNLKEQHRLKASPWWTFGPKFWTSMANGNRGLPTLVTLQPNLKV